jgi:RNA-directed DNA polymerase
MPSSCDFSTKLERIAQLASEAADMSFTSLSHHIDIGMLKEAYKRTRKDGAAGVDGQTASEYELALEGNLQSLLSRVKSGIYRAPPVRRVHIPKGSGSETRAIGIPTLEDKILQRSVSMILEAIYEQDFLDCSYGFRPGRSAHQMLEALWKQLMNMGDCYVIEVDISKFFDTLNHTHLREILSHRVRDGVLTRLIGKWLNAGVMEDGRVSYQSVGSPQGGVVSPLLSNVFLNEVVDQWFEEVVKPRLLGAGCLFRYADDIIIVLKNEHDAQRMMDVLPKRLGKYDLTLHPEKTRVVHFAQGSKDSSFELLGFTHYWGKARNGLWAVKRKTARKRFSAAIKRIGRWCREARSLQIPEQHRLLTKKLIGHYSYYGITGNYKALARFHYEVRRQWKKWLSRRSWKTSSTWDWFKALIQRFPLPQPIVTHSVRRHVAKI